MEHTTLSRDETIQRIRRALRERTGRSWSVAGGRGTAYGWITIQAPPARQVCAREGACGPDCQHSRGYTAPEDLALLALALRRQSVHFQGESIPASSEYYAEYVDRAEGRVPAVCGTPYWD